MIDKELQKRLLSSIILIPISIFFIFQGSIYFIFFLSLLFFVTSYEWFNLSKKNELLRVFGILFLFLSFFVTYLIRESFFNFFFLIILICIFTDIGGYIFGKVFKGPKLTKISPNKTYTGVLGSFLLSFIAGMIYLNYLGNRGIFKEDNLEIFHLILFISLISQIGDLIISYFKRKAKLKDTGKVLPGHGGLLDRIDGLIFALPASYILILIVG